MPTSRLSCPCCGYRTLLSESEGGLCEVCGWLTLPSAEQSEWKWRHQAIHGTWKEAATSPEWKQER